MLSSLERREGSPAALAFGAEAQEEGLRVGVLITNARCPDVITLDGTRYVVPSSLLSNTDPQVGRNICLREEMNDHEKEEEAGSQ